MPEAKQLPQYVAALLAAGYALATGLALGWTNPIETKAKDGSLGFNVTEEDFSWVGSGLPLGAIVSCIPTGFLIDAFGRQFIAVILLIPYAIGWLVIVFANASWMLICARVLLGIASGASCVVIPVYIGEIAQKEIRGTLGSFFQLQITIGILIIYIMGAFLDVLPMNIICTIVPIVFAVIMGFLPETPLFLVKKEKFERAMKSFRWLRGKEYDTNVEMAVVKDDIERSKQTTFFAGFRNRVCIKALYISIGVMFFQQFSGINAVIFYSTTIFKFSGSSLEPRFSTIVIGVVQVIATLIAVIFVDRLGRRLLLLISSSVMALSTCVLGIYFFLQDRDETTVKDIGWIPITALCVYIIVFSFGFGPVPWIMVGELFPAEVKGPAGSLSGTSNWMFAFVVAKIYPTLKNAIGAGETFWVFSILTVIGFFFVLFLVPETKNKSLSEIQDMLKGDRKE